MRLKGSFVSDNQRRAAFANMTRRLEDHQKQERKRERQFLWNYPVRDAVFYSDIGRPRAFKRDQITDEEKEREFLDGLHYVTYDNPRKEMGLSWHCMNYAPFDNHDEAALKERLETAKRLEKKGYIKIRDNGFGGYEVIQKRGGLARYMKDNKGWYAAKTQEKLKENEQKLRESVLLERELLIKSLDEQIRIWQENALKAKDNKYIENPELLIAEYLHDIETAKVQKRLLRINKLVLEGNKKLSYDIGKVLEKYFDIDPSFLTNNILKVEYFTDPSSSLRGLFTVRLAPLSILDSENKYVRPTLLSEIRINKAFTENLDLSSSASYQHLLVHELVHWLRRTDARRQEMSGEMRHAFIDKDLEEKNTVKETVVRLGDDNPIGVFSYYSYLRSILKDKIFDPALEDNKRLTINYKPVSDIDSTQVSEDLRLRGRTALIDNLKIDGKGEWIDTYFETGTGQIIQAYSPNPTSSPKQIAKEINGLVGLADSEKLYEWRDGKKFLVSKAKNRSKCRLVN